VITALRTSYQPWLDLSHRRHIQESPDRVIHYKEDIDSIREPAQITKDELTNALADKMSKNLYMPSVVAAIFLP
jgi:zinc transporter